MNDREQTTNYIRAFDQLTALISDVELAIHRAVDDQDQLSEKQYKHLKMNYVQQLAELIGRAPLSVKVQAVVHQ